MTTLRRCASLFVALLLVVARACDGAAAMNNPGYFTLGDYIITAAGTQVTPQSQAAPNGAYTGFAGIAAASFQVCLRYGSGGSTITVYLQTSLDSGQTFIDIGAVAFATAGGCQM